MSDRLRESLSALVDGEASEFELRRVLDSDDTSLRASWNDYHRLRHVMVDGGLPHGSLDISASVAEAIAAEGAGRRSWRDLARPLGGVAVAASVAAVVVFGVRGIDQRGVDQMAATDSAATGRVYPVMQGDNVSVGSPATTARAPASGEPAAQVVLERFDHYMERHAERAALNSPQGMVSYARVVSHETD